MNPPEPRCRMILASVRLAAVLVALEAVRPVASQELSKDEGAPLAERNRLQQRAQELFAAGKLVEAIKTIEKKLSFDERTFGRDSVPVADTLGSLSQLQALAEDFGSALDSAERAYGCWFKQLGNRHWRVVTARLAVEYVKQLSRMDRDQRHKLADADRDRLRVIPLAQGGQAAEAIVIATRAGTFTNRC